ncbi:hypothetical protein ACFO1B_36965 [Dactylosporangium siamense]|uniref:Uncharacterized protein n=1 Tax=Dactylosporangium siamense TaxID=685454 RepID=A0A919UER9_9ACTN|nr:hypothetical protein [Dactylosporangium siamense]GIG49361.1 hypothetical protein Dsi01nite_074020 [Dactylosporangium siamense]
MPTQLHETVIAMFRERPALAAELLEGPLHAGVPSFNEARLSPGDLTDVAPAEYRADAVVTLSNQKRTVLAVVVEVQLKADARKRRSWPVYVATLHARLKCPVALLVVCPAQQVARWSAAPISIGPPGSVVTPVAVGPDQIPLVTDLTIARKSPELAVLSTLAHGGRTDPQPLFEALLTGLHVIDQEQADLYTDLVLTVLPAAARAYLEALMTTTAHQYQSDFARRNFSAGEARGEARGEAKAVLVVLDARGVTVSEEQRTLIADCTDQDQLETWLRRVGTAEKIQDLGDQFAG